MSVLAWRRLLLTLCAFAFLQLGVDVWMQELHFGSLPGFAVPFFGPSENADSVQKIPTATANVYELTFPESSPLAQTGLHSGDLLDLRALSPGARYRWATGFWRAGEEFQATIIRGPSVRHVTLTAQWLPLDWYARIANVGLFWMYLFATILAWQRADSGEARALALLLTLSNIGLNFQAQNWITPWPVLDAVVYSLSWPIWATGIVMLATYAMLFARPANALRRALAWASYAGAVASTILGAAWPLAVLFAVPYLDGVSRVRLSDRTSELSFGIPLICFLVTIAQTRGTERTRIAWASASLVPFYLIYTVPLAVLGYPVVQWVLYGDNLALFLVPLGLTYSLLGRRLLDIDFALNRAAIFAVTSLLLAGLFAGLQWVANAFFTGLVHVHNVIVDMIIVIIVYYAMRVSRRETDALVNRLFFAARNRRLQALGELANMVDEISEADAITPLTAQYLRTRAGIEASVFLQAPDGAFVPAGGCAPGTPAIARDDLGVVTLKSRRETIVEPEWRDLGVAIPMLVRGQVRGILFCQPPDDGDFAPDDMQLLQSLANRMATDRDDLLAASLRQELDALRSEMTELRARQHLTVAPDRLY